MPRVPSDKGGSVQKLDKVVFETPVSIKIGLICGNDTEEYTLPAVTGIQGINFFGKPMLSVDKNDGFNWVCSLDDLVYFEILDIDVSSQIRVHI